MVLVCIIDMQGRSMGKYFVAQHFVDGGWEETHCCNYLLATPDGCASTSWESGYGDYVMKPDLDTLRPVPWLDGTVMILIITHEPISHLPRVVLQNQIAKNNAAAGLSFTSTKAALPTICPGLMAIATGAMLRQYDWHVKGRTNVIGALLVAGVLPRVGLTEDNVDADIFNL